MAGRLGILRGIADENGLRSGIQSTRPLSTMSSFPLVDCNT
jgi:hypothetical protein